MIAMDYQERAFGRWSQSHVFLFQYFVIFIRGKAEDFDCISPSLTSFI